MADLNTMPLFTDSYVADTKHLKTVEHGAYLLLLISMWRNGGWLPSDPNLLARYAGIEPRNWPKMWAIIGPFFRESEPGKIVQKKLDATYKKALEKRNKYRENGKKGGEAKALKSNDEPVANATNSLDQSESPALPYLNPESSNRNAKDSAPSGAAPAKKKKPKKTFEEMTPNEREKKLYFDRALQVLGERGGALAARLFNSFGGDVHMPQSTAKARNALENAVRAKGDIRAYLGAVISNGGKEAAKKGEGWDTGL